MPSFVADDPSAQGWLIRVAGQTAGFVLTRADGTGGQVLGEGAGCGEAGAVLALDPAEGVAERCAHLWGDHYGTVLWAVVSHPDHRIWTHPRPCQPPQHRPRVSVPIWPDVSSPPVRP